MTTNPHGRKEHGIMEKIEDGSGGACEDENLP